MYPPLHFHFLQKSAPCLSVHPLAYKTDIFFGTNFYVYYINIFMRKKKGGIFTFLFQNLFLKSLVIIFCVLLLIIIITIVLLLFAAHLLCFPKTLYNALSFHSPVGQYGNECAKNQKYQEHPKDRTPDPFCGEKPQNMLQLSKHQALHQKA